MEHHLDQILATFDAVAALKAGGAAVVTGLASAAIADAYVKLKSGISPHLADKPRALKELDSATPDIGLLRTELAGTPAAHDPHLLAAARRAQDVLPGAQRVDVRDSPGAHVFGMHVGTHTVTQHFGDSPRARESAVQG